MVGLADLKKHFDNVKKCHMSLNNKYCYFSLTGVNTLDFLDVLNYKSWVYKTFQKMVNIRYVYIIKKLENGNTIVRTSVGFAPLLLRYLRIKGFQIRDEDIEVFKARNIVFPDLKIILYDFQDRMVNDWLSAGGIGVVKCPTGGGKTILACSMIKQIGRKTLILVHTSDLLINVWNDSLVKSFGQGIMGQVGIIGGGLTDKDRAAMRLGVRSGDFDENIRKDIVIATFQTLMNRMDDLTQYKFGLMIVDECIPIDSKIWTNDGIVKYEDLGYGQDYKREVFQVWSRNDNDNIVNNGYKKIKTRMKHMYRTIVETGDDLVCSLDHKVLTRKSDGTEEFVEIENAKNMARALIRPYDMREECIMARIFGYMIGDGNVTYGETGFNVIRRRCKYYGGSATGDYDGLLKMKYDIRKLGYESADIRSKYSNSEITRLSGEKTLVQGHAYMFGFANDLASRLVKLGYPAGNKTDIIYKIPDWIMQGSKDIKREFLAGYMGADGTTPYFDDKDEQRKRSFNAPLFSINKRQDIIEESMEIVDQLKKLFEEFGVSFTRVNIYDGNIRKDGTITKTIQIVLTGDNESLRNFLEIGFRYCIERERLGDMILSYLKYIRICNEELKELQKILIDIHDRIGKAPSKIVNIINDIRSPKQLDIFSSWGDVDIKDTIKRKNLINLTASSLSHLLYEDRIVESPGDILGFKEWRNKVSRDFIFLDILRHEYRGYEQGYTLTVNGNHNYLVNGFDILNCHHVPANMFRKVNAVIRAPYKLGLSATTTRLDGMEKDCFGQLGDIRSTVSIRELINRGILAEPRFQSPIIVDREIIDSIQDSGLSGLNYSRFVKKKSAASQKKKDYIVNICKNIAARDRKFLLFTDYVNAEDVFVRDNYADSLLKEDVSVSIIDQGMASDERSSVFNFLEKGEISGIVFGKLGSEGVNIPSVDVVVMANAIKCISGDILVPTDKGIIRAEDLENVKPNTVFTINPDDGSVITAKINEFYNFDEEDTIRITTLKGYEIEGSVSHMIVTGWSCGNIIYTSLSDINIGDSILIYGNVYGKEDRDLAFYDRVISKKKSMNKLYDMNIDKYHSFIAGGFINHNSPITFTQRVGRTMRRVPGKDFCDVYEVLLDLPTEMKWSDFNFAEYRAEGFQKLTYKVE